MMNEPKINTAGTADTIPNAALDDILTSLPTRISCIENFRYPDGIQTAVTFTVDFDAMLHRKLVNDPPLSVTKGEFGGRVGIWRLLDLFARYDIKTTLLTVGRICELYPDSLKEAVRHGHELAEHMWEHHVPKDRELAKDHLRKVTGALEKILGKKPIGSRSRFPVQLLKEEGYQYASFRSYADEIPYYAYYEGVKDPILTIPFHFALDDAMYTHYGIFGSKMAGQRLQSPDVMFDVWLSTFKEFYKTGKYFSLCLHPFISGRSSRVAMLEKLILEMKTLPGVWFCTCEEMYRYCNANFPPAG